MIDDKTSCREENAEGTSAAPVVVAAAEWSHLLAWRPLMHSLANAVGELAMWSRVAQVLLFLVPGVVSLDAQGAPHQKPLRVLFIGNSYTFFNLMPQQLQTLVALADEPRLLEVHQETRPGADLRSHWNDTMTLKVIRRGAWDHVVLQEQSRAPITRPDSMLKYARLLGEEIRRVGAKPLLFVTWAPKDRPADQAALTSAYQRAAVEVDGDVVPVGAAVAIMRQRSPGIEFFHDDGSHPRPIGSYLAACTFFAYLFDRSPVGLPALAFRTTYQSLNLADVDIALERLPESEARSVQESVWEAVQTHRGTRRGR